jgi:hypothetical protein
MPFPSTLFDRALHLVMFGAGAAAFGFAALLVMERLSEDARRTIRPRFIVISAAAFVVLLVIERTYHALS